MSKKTDLLKAAKREKTFSTLAKKEAAGARERVKHSTGANKKDNQDEVDIDQFFANERAKRAFLYKDKAKKL